MGLFSLIKQTLSMKNEEKMRIGLSQFKNTSAKSTTSNSDVSIRSKEIKLSDLMRRTNNY